MKIVVFGANGRVGTKVVQKLLEREHTVRAFVHGNTTFEENKNLEVVQADIHDKGAVSNAIAGMDIVISTLGSWGTPTKDIQVSAMQNILPAMKKAEIKRIVSLTGAGVFDETDSPSLLDRFNRFLISHGAKKVFYDGEQHVRLLRASQLDWTVLRSPIMKEKGMLGRYKLSQSFPAPWATITRDDVATALVNLAESKEWLQQSPFIARN